MTQNPYDTPAIVDRDADALATEKRLNILARITIVSCSLWFGMMIVGRILDNNAPPIHTMLGFYALVGVPSALGLYGALATLKRKRYIMCLLGAVCTSIPLFGPWCGLTVPIGIWSLILLRSPSIRASFATASHVDATQADVAEDVLAHAARLHMRGEWEAAIAIYRGAAERWPEHSTYINHCIAEITATQSAAAS